MSKSIYIMTLVISFLWGCNPVTEKKGEEKKINTLSIKPKPKAIISTIDTVIYAQEVQKYADSVDKNLSGLAKVKIEVFGASAEGGEISVYTKDSDIIKLKALYYGETGNNEFELYLRNKKVVFFSEKTIFYKSPISRNSVKVSKKNSKFFVMDDYGIVSGREGNKSVPKGDYTEKFEDIKILYKEIKLQLRE